MRLTRRITLAISLLFVAVVAAESYLTLQQELALIDRDLQRDGRMLAASMRALVENTDRHEAQRRALKWLREIGDDDDRVVVGRIMEASLGPPESQTGIPPDISRALQEEPQRIISMYSPDGAPHSLDAERRPARTC